METIISYEADILEQEYTESDQAEKQQTFQSLGILGKLHNIIAHSRSSAGRTEEFRSFANRLIPLNNFTR